jgi:hypothetical protein
MEIAQSRKLSLALLIGTAIAVAIVAFDFFGRMEAMRPQGESARAATSAHSGEPVKVMLELTQAPVGNTFAGTILEDAGSSQFRVTAKSLRITLDAASRFVMGDRSNLGSGAVVQVSGRATGSGAVQAAQIVVLTGDVSVLPKP